jgi:hypothetical protein
MQMRAFELQRIKQAKSLYYSTLGYAEKDDRTRKQSLARAAFVCAFRNYATLEELASITGRDHSTLSYALKEHNYRVEYEDYFKMYQVACSVRDKIDLSPMEIYDIEGLHSEIKRLNEVVTELIKYKELYLTLKKTFDEF